MSRRGEAVVAVLGGLVVSLAAGLFGVGGGVLMVPLLVLVLGRSQHVAHATSLVAVLFAATSGTIAFARAGAVDLPTALVLGGAAVISAQAGARLLPRLTDRALRRLFVLVLVAIAIRFLVGGSGAATGATAVPDLTVGMIAVLLVLGAVIGVASAVLGVGGGILMVPAMVLLLGYGQHVAEGISLLVVIPTALSGAIAHHRRGYTDWTLGGLLGVTGLVGGAAGAILALGLDPDTLGRLFGGLMAIVAGLMLVEPRRRRS